MRNMGAERPRLRLPGHQPPGRSLGPAAANRGRAVTALRSHIDLTSRPTPPQKPPPLPAQTPTRTRGPPPLRSCLPLPHLSIQPGAQHSLRLLGSQPQPLFLMERVWALSDTLASNCHRYLWKLNPGEHLRVIKDARDAAL